MTASLNRVRRSADDGGARSAEAPPGESSLPTVADAQARDHDPSQDSATYSCSCGFVFDADVNTTVACPHCGLGQAW
jgi:hypothetical protein